MLTYSPVDQVRRPKADDETASVGLTLDELDALLSAAEAHGHRSGALVSLLAYNGLRIAEALGADIADYRYQRGHRVLQITRKGGKRVEVPLAPPLYERSTLTSRPITPTPGRCSSPTVAAGCST